MNATEDLTGKVFGRLTVSYRPNPPYHKDSHGRTMWWCVCECGMMTRVARVALMNGKTKSCGCLRADVARETMKEKRAGSKKR